QENGIEFAVPPACAPDRTSRLPSAREILPCADFQMGSSLYLLDSSAFPVMSVNSETEYDHEFQLACRLFVHFQHGEEGLLRDLDLADALHALLAFLLFFEQLAFARDVAAVTLRQHVLAHRLDRLAGDHARTDGRLDRDFKHLARDELAHLFDQRAPPAVSEFLMHDQ